MDEDIHGWLEGEMMDEWLADLLVSGQVGGHGHSIEGSAL